LVAFRDLFSRHSKGYAASRPNYPKAMFDFLAGLVERRNLAWDCATGNGQAAVFLAEHFDRVVASDASSKQIENAHVSPNIRFAVFPAEKADLEDNSVDLITVAQALHWFRFDDFYREARRVARKDAIIAVWTYWEHYVSPEVDKLTRTFYMDIVGSYWPAEIKYIENRYKDIPFPFQQVDAPIFRTELEWSLRDLVGYMYTWSSVQKYVEENGSDPVEKLYPALEEAWGKNLTEKRKVTWPLYLKVGRIAAG
jgi:hypothetical protein